MIFPTGVLRSFEDDSKLCLSFPVKNAGEVMRKIDEDLSKRAAWCCYNSLLINPGKTKMLVIGTREMLQKLPENFNVTLLGKKITPNVQRHAETLVFNWIYYMIDEVFFVIHRPVFNINTSLFGARF